MQITLDILRQAKQRNTPALWIQPGAEDAAVVEYIKENGLSDRVIFRGPCILTQGDNILKSML
jgi:predicted CoA-binding protein